MLIDFDVATRIAANGHALAMAGHSMNFQREQKYSKRTKVEIFILLLNR
jgi:hypothetical protein